MFLDVISIVHPNAKNYGKGEEVEGGGEVGVGGEGTCIGHHAFMWNIQPSFLGQVLRK